MHHSHSAVHCVTKLSGFLDWIVSEAGAVFYHNVSVWFWIVYGLKKTKIFCCQWYLGCRQKSFPMLRLFHEDDISTNVRWFCQNRANNILQEMPLLCPWIYVHCTPIYLEKESNNQNGNLRWFLPWREGGLEFHLPILKNDFFEKHSESFPDC